MSEAATPTREGHRYLRDGIAELLEPSTAGIIQRVKLAPFDYELQVLVRRIAISYKGEGDGRDQSFAAFLKISVSSMMTLPVGCEITDPCGSWIRKRRGLAVAQSYTT